MVKTAPSLLFIVLLSAAVCLAQGSADPLEAAKDSYNACLGFAGDSRGATASSGKFEEYFREAKGRTSSDEVSDAMKKDDRLRELLAKESGRDAGFKGRAKDLCLTDAAGNIESALSEKRNAGKPDVLTLKGNIYAGIAERLTEQGADPSRFLKYIESEDSEVTAYETLQQALKAAGSNDQKLAVLKGMFDLQPTLGKLGTRYFDNGDYKKAGRDFDLMFSAHDTLSRERASSFLKDKANNSLAQYFKARVQIETGDATEGRKTLEKLFKDGYPEAGVYSTLYTLTLKEKGREAALPYLQKGRKILPDDSSLLILEINDGQNSGDPGSAVDNLKKAIAQQPENASLRVTLAQAYDRLFLIEANRGDPAKAKELFRNAADFYKQALDMEPTNFAASYGLGALYFNNAAVVAKDLKQYEGIATPEATAKFDEILKDVYTQFDKALPYLKKAETLDPNDAKTLNALIQIYDRKGEPALSGEFRRRLSTVQSGGKNERSFFEGH